MQELKGSINRDGSIEEEDDISAAIISKLTKSNPTTVSGKKMQKGKRPLPKVDDILTKNRMN
jgi:hypothetical protein